MTEHPADRFDVVVIGGGQAGLATGYHLRHGGARFAILDAHQRVGDTWRHRWDGLRVFTPARYDALPGMRFPAPDWSLPGKDDVADYLERYAAEMQLPVRTGVRVESLGRSADGAFLVSTSAGDLAADQVVVATGAYQAPKIPALARELDPAIHQVHAVDYRNARQLRDGPVLVVGASNSGAEIALSASADHPTTLVGRDTGTMPVRPESRGARLFDPPFWFFINRIARVDNPVGRAAIPLVRDRGTPLERIRPGDLEAAGVERIVARVDGATDGRPRLDDGRTLDVANIVWCTGFAPRFDWIRLPRLELVDGWPVHRRGIVDAEPGLYFVGLPFLFSGGSALIGGVGRDAAHVATAIARRRAETDRVAARSVAAAGGAAAG